MFMSFSIKNRLLTISILPLVVLASVMLAQIFNKVNNLMSKELETAEQLFSKAKNEELKHVVSVAWGGIKTFYESGGDRETAIRQLELVQFGEDGYLFGYDSKGTRLLLGGSNKGIGKNFYDAQDAKQNYFIRDIIKVGRQNGLAEGDNYVDYYFPRLGETKASAKRSYTIYLPRWDMILGTGLYVDSIDLQIQNMAESLKNTRNALLWSVAVTALVLSLLLTVIGILLTRSILQPLTSIGNSIRDIAQGGGDLTRRLPSDNNAELGIVAAHMNALLDSLHRMITDILGIAREVGEETFALASSIEQTKKVSIQQHREVEQVATAMTEMSQTSRETAQNAEQAAAAALVASSASTRASDAVQQSCDAMRLLGEEITNASNVITEVGKDVENISEILQVIETIAEQTNLLALNAAIEAARAGEQGRGFAVVADEVRNLASKTQGSTEQIQKMIAKLQSGSASAVAVMTESISRSDLTESSIANTANLLTEIAESIGTITDMNAQIATAAEEQSVVGSDISARIVAISEQANESSEIASRNETRAITLRKKTRALEAIVDRFKL